MKKSVKKITLNRETLRNLNVQSVGNAVGGKSIPCYPASYVSCDAACPVQPVTVTTPMSRDNCA